jgi:hypothetical protein
MDHAVEVASFEDLFECCRVANVDFVNAVTWIFQVFANVVALD